MTPPDPDKFNKFILSNAYGNIVSVGFAKKNISGQETDIPAIVFTVENKLPTDELKNRRIKRLPKKIIIDGQEYISDVVQGSVRRLACEDCYTQVRTPAGRDLRDGFQDPNEQYRYPDDTREKMFIYRGATRPVRGGASISVIPDSGNPNDPVMKIDGNYQISYFGGGTLGFIAVDSLTKNLVGVTNAHVGAVVDTDDKAAFSARGRASTIFRSRVYNTLNLKVYQEFQSAQAVEWMRRRLQNEQVHYYENFVLPKYWWKYLNIGQTKRYFPFKRNGESRIDCALLELITRNETEEVSLPNVPFDYADPNFEQVPAIRWQADARVVVPEINWQILGFPHGQKYFPFASTSEILSLPNNTNIKYFIAGRTTGAKGLPGEMIESETAYNNATCKYLVKSVSRSVKISQGTAKNGKGITTTISPSIELEWSGCPNADPSQPGDSGSAVLALLDGVWKIIGLLYGGYTEPPYTAIICRIDHIASLMKIEPYYGQELTGTPTATPRDTIIVKNMHSVSSFVHKTNKKTYYQVGTTTQAANTNKLPI